MAGTFSSFVPHEDGQVTNFKYDGTLFYPITWSFSGPAAETDRRVAIHEHRMATYSSKHVIFMGRRILQQRAGRGGFPYRAPTHRRIGPVSYLPLIVEEKTITAEIIEFRHETGRGTPLGVIRWDDGKKDLYLPAEGQFVGDKIEFGPNADTRIGNIKSVKNIPDGTLVYNVELKPGDGGKVARASGLAATVIEHSEKGVWIHMPSGKKHMLHPKCRATVGVVCAGGRTEKPFIKAGNKWYLMRARGRKWPRSRGIVMNCNSHPYGGGSHCGAHMPKTTSRNAPPGRKVGLIAARRTGLRKK
jgi:large subunit ribosomal protein L2